MPKFQVELRKWVEFSTLVEVDAPSPSRARAIALATIEEPEDKPENLPDWQRTGMIRKPVVVAMGKLTQGTSTCTLK